MFLKVIPSGAKKREKIPKQDQYECKSGGRKGTTTAHFEMRKLHVTRDTHTQHTKRKEAPNQTLSLRPQLKTHFYMWNSKSQFSLLSRVFLRLAKKKVSMCYYFFLNNKFEFYRKQLENNLSNPRDILIPNLKCSGCSPPPPLRPVRAILVKIIKH